MSAARPSLVVLTPVRNEAWILERFLGVTSKFADLILVLDQNSTDGSREICRRNEKVVVIEAESSDYDEGKRQIRLIEEARSRVTSARILLALDADEMLAGDAMSHAGWNTLFEAPPGTVLCFEKVDLVRSTTRCIRRPADFAMGFVDDGSAHRPLCIHSTRVPTPDHAVHLEISDVKFLHYGLTRPATQRAKQRFYTIVEKANGLQPIWRRWSNYARATCAFEKLYDPFTEPSDSVWFERWEAEGIDMHSIQRTDIDEQDLWSLDLLLKHGAGKFYWDDVWDADWTAVQRELIRREPACAHDAVIKAPSAVQQALAQAAIHACALIRRCLR